MSTSKEISDMLDELLAAESSVFKSQDEAARHGFGMDDILDSYAVNTTSKASDKKDGITAETETFVDNPNSPVETRRTGKMGVSFNNLQPLVINFEEKEILNTCNSRDPLTATPSTQRSILKTPSKEVIPDTLPMKPEEYIMSDEASLDDSGSDSDTSEIECPSDEEDQDIDAEADGDEPYAANSFFGEYEEARKSSIFADGAVIDTGISLVGDFEAFLQKQDYESPLLPDSKKIAPNNTSSTSPAVFTYFGSGYSTPTTPSIPERKKDVERKPSPPKISNKITDDDDDDNTPLQALQEKEPTVDRTREIINQISESNFRKVNARVYIETPHKYQSKTITSLTNAIQLIQEVTQSSDLNHEWALFELCNTLGIERPLREWEIVTDVLSAWNQQSSNVILIKKYQFKATLSTSYLRGTYPKSQGFMYLQLTPGKWHKRFCFLRKHCLYYLSEKDKSDSEVLFCDLTMYDVYTSLKPHSKFPTPNYLAIRSDMHASAVEKNEYLYYCCVDKESRLLDWVLALRLAKAERMSAIKNGSESITSSEVTNKPSPGSTQPLVSVKKVTKMKPGSLLEDSPTIKHRSKSLKSTLERKGKKSSSSSASSSSSEKKKKSKKPLIEL